MKEKFKPLRLRHLPYISLTGNTEGEFKSIALPFAEKLREGEEMRPTFLPCVAT